MKKKGHAVLNEVWSEDDSSSYTRVGPGNTNV